jgi:hypothetical protein
MTVRDLIGRIGSFLVSLVLRRPGDFLASMLFFFGLRPGYVEQNGMLILTDIGPGDEPGNQVALLWTLENIRKRLKGNRNERNISFYNAKTVHYAAWMILPGIKREGELPGPAKLAFETNYDGSRKDHLQDLVDNCRHELDEVYSFFSDYPPRESERSSVKDFLCTKYRLTDKSVNASAYYVALPGRSLKDIVNAITVYHEAKNFVDDLSNTCSEPEELRSALIDHFQKRAKEDPERFTPSPVTQKGLRRLFGMNILVLMLLCLVPPIVSIHWYHWLMGRSGLWSISIAVLTVLCLLPLLYLLRWFVIDVVARYFEAMEVHREQRQELFDPTGRKADYRHLDLGRQNHLCTYTTVKPGWFRMYVIKRGLWLGPVLFKYFFIQGKLDQISTIHFARWTLIGQQLIFYGSYDGSWSAYLNDFSDEAWGVNLLWGNTIGFPETRFIVWGGARDLEGFQAQAAEHYAPAPVFYSAYRDHSLANLLRYLAFREGLIEEMASSPTTAPVSSKA